MTQQVLIGNNGHGFTQNRQAFNIDNDAFNQLFNAYVWRGRVKRKRGTVLLNRLQRQQALNSVLVADSINLLTAILPGEPNATLAPGYISVTVGANTYTDNSPPDGTLVGTPGGTGTINYLTGLITIAGGGAAAITGTFDYYPDLPVMGIRDFLNFNPAQAPFAPSSLYPLQLAFDTTYSYQINQNATPFYYTTNFYKGVNNPVFWTGGDFQQFWTVNYSSALWATNEVPGFHFQHISVITVGVVTTITTLLPHGLQNGDWVFFNEITGPDAGNLNLKSEQVTVTGANTFTVPINTLANVINNSGIFQTLTNSSGALGDGIRWYDGDPTNGTGLYAGTGKGWVNFAPPLTDTVVSINDQSLGLYYLVGCTAIVPFKDRLLFFGPYIQTSSGAPIYLPDVVIYSWNGTPYYTNPTPTGGTFDARAYYVDQTGFGGWIAAGVAQEIITVNPNEDVLIVSFTNKHTRFAYSGDDILPFVFFSINSEQIGAISTFSAINFDRGVMSIGDRGITLTSQISSQRLDLVIPDQVFTINAANNGVDRVNSVRDFENEWVYHSYPSTNNPWRFPTQTFMFNYRDDTWSILFENYTARGYYRKTNTANDSWLTLPYDSWNEWNVPWISGQDELQYSSLASGNQQGFVMLQDLSTGEDPSGYVLGVTQVDPITFNVFSPDHCLLEGDYVYLLNLIGTTGLAGLIGKVKLITIGGVPDPDNFQLVFLATQNPSLTGTYIGGGTFSRLSIPYIQTKQFNFFWNEGRQVRLASQRYLFDTTNAGQVTVNINLAQDDSTTWNAYPPNVGPSNTGLEYSQIVYTCPEGTNLLAPPDNITAPNINLQNLIALPPGTPAQTWHRMNTSLQGSTVQLTITLSDSQMRNLVQATSEIALHAIHLNIGKGPYLA